MTKKLKIKFVTNKIRMFFINLIHKDYFSSIWSEINHLNLAINRHRIHRVWESYSARLSIYNQLVTENRNRF
jgi:hypothetical protein